MSEETKLDFMQALKKCEYYITHPDKEIKESDELNKCFPPRYLFDIYAVTNVEMPKYFNDNFYYNTDYNIYFKVTTTDMIEMIRDYNTTHALYPYQIMKTSKKDNEFKKDFENLKEHHKSGLGKPEMEIFLKSIKMNNEEEQYFKTTERQEKKNAKLSMKEYEKERSKGFAFYHEFLNNVFLKPYNITDTFGNMPYDIKEADIIFLHNNGVHEDTKSILNTFINHYMLNEYKYLVINIANDNNAYKQVISNTMPKAVVVLGADTCKTIGLEHTGIINRSGKMETFDEIEYIISVGLPYLVKNQTEEAYNTLGNTFQTIRDILVPRQNYRIEGRVNIGDTLTDGQIYAYDKLPKKFYEAEWVLLDITKDGFKTVTHSFRNADTNEKVIKKVSANEFNYYYIAKDHTAVSKPSVKCNEVYCRKGPWKFSKDKDIIERYNQTTIFEGDVSPDDKAVTDYYYTTKEEKSYLPQVFRYDIEHDISDFHGTDITAPYKVTYISAEYNGEYYMWILESDKVSFRESTYEAFDDGLPDKKTKKVKTYPRTRKLHIFEFANNESFLIQHFWYTLCKVCNPDIMTGWNNLGFDFPYMINRSKRLPYYHSNEHKCTEFTCAKIIDMLEMMEIKYSCPNEEDRWTPANLTGIIVSDLQRLYEDQHQNALESYALNFIADLELGLGKKPFPAADASKDEWIVYNLWDTELMELIDYKVQATNYRFFLSKIARGTWNGVAANASIVSSLLLFEAKCNGNVLRTSKLASISTNKYIDKFPGGFTQTNKGGLFEMLVDYDGKSMYPSLMRTFNIGPNTLRYTMPPKDAHSIMTDNFYDKDKEVKVYKAELYFQDGHELGYEIMKLGDIAKMVKERNYIITPSGAIFCSMEEEKSILYDILNTLCNERDRVKSQMYDSDGNKDIAKYNKQLALKVSANAFFGVFGFATFFYYNTTMATAITTTGRMMIKCIMHSIENRYQKNGRSLLDSARSIDVFQVRDLNFKYTIYADTDGCVIQFGDILKELGITKLEDKLKWAEAELIPLNKYIRGVVDEIYTYFNQNEPSARFMYFKEDFYANKGLFYPDKHKYYAIHLIRENGKDQDHVEYRGIAVRKSTYPKIVKERLIELLDMVLGKEDVKLDVIMDRISQIESEFYGYCNDGSMLLGTPTKLGGPFESYKARPQNVDAMSLWNAINKREDFRALSKGYLFNIASIDFYHPDLNLTEDEIANIKKNHRMTSICVPLDTEKVPEWINIDIKATMDKVWTTPYTNILGPVIESSSSSDECVMDWL